MAGHVGFEAKKPKTETAGGYVGGPKKTISYVGGDSETHVLQSLGGDVLLRSPVSCSVVQAGMDNY